MHTIRNSRKQLRQRHHQPKRTPYVDQACYECKRRKVKCNGEEPCGKCIRYSTTCSYAPHQRSDSQHASLGIIMNSSEQQNSHRDTESHAEIALNSPPRSVENLNIARAQTVPGQHGRPASASQTLRTSSDLNADSPEFCGPSSTEFTLNVVNGNLRAMGIPSAILAKSNYGSLSQSSISSRLAQYGPFMKLLALDPLWEIRREDAVKDIEHWFNGTGSLYPVVSRDQMLDTAHNILGTMENARIEANANRGALVESLFTNEANKLKLILAIGRTAEIGGRNDQAQRLLQSSTEAIEGLLWNTNTINNIQLLVLMALYYYHLDEEVRTGRIIGFAARLCLEMGLHRRAMINTLRNTEEQTVALKTFWCVYMLERRTSLGQGVPFSIQDSHIDPSLFEMLDLNPAMHAMLNWTKLAGKTWQALNSQGEKEADVKTDELDFLEFQIMQWYQNLPDDLKLDHGNQEIKHIHAVLFLRKCHLHNLIYRPVLQSAARIGQFHRYAFAAVKIAKESLQFLSNLNENTAIIQQSPVFFKHLLLTAFGNLLLAVVNASSTFSDSVKSEFDIALDLIRALSDRSPLLMSLWKRLQGLRKLQSQLSDRSVTGVPDSRELHDQPQSSDALLFDELFPLPAGLGSPLTTEALDDFVGGTMVKDHMNGLFDFPVRSGGLFDGPFSNWECYEAAGLDLGRCD